MLQPMLGEDIDLVLQVDPDHGWVRVDPVQLEQIIVNLAVNARDAMDTGGTLTLAVESPKPTDVDKPDATAASGPIVRIRVTDTGTGMDEGTISRIFDPFFTTKPAGKGTGLGLATVFGIVAQSDGQIYVESAPGKGTTFTLDFPRVSVPRTPRSSVAQAALNDSEAGVILLAEDEPAVREFTKRALERAGYTVLAAQDGDEALRASRAWDDRIDVLVTDVVMPGMHGPELAYRIRQTRPDVGILYMSGYAEDAVNTGGEFATPGGFLPKPFTSDGLIRAIRRAGSEAS
jgi:two-component system, cell cycle sensor histidine kinase and response regulator CckA